MGASALHRGTTEVRYDSPRRFNRRREAWKQHDVDALTQDHAAHWQEVQVPGGGGLHVRRPEDRSREAHIYDFTGVLARIGVLKTKPAS